MFSAGLLPQHARVAFVTWRARVLLLAALLTGAVVLLGLVAGMSLVQVRDDLLRAGTAARAGVDQLDARSPARAARAFGEAEAAFLQAHERLNETSVTVVSALPPLRTNIHGARTLAAAGAAAAGAGLRLATGVQQLPDGPAALAPRNGSFPLEAFARIQAPVTEAAERMERSHQLLGQLPSTGLHPRLAEAGAEMAEGVEGAHTALQAADALVRNLPTFLGADGPRRYFLGAANPAELRGSGGFVGAYAILTADQGRLRVGPFNPIQDLPDLHHSQVAAPNADFARRYNDFGGAGFWMNITMSPDFPSVGEAIERLYEQVTGERLDGTVLVAPLALRALLEVSGPAEVPNVGVISADNVLRVVANEAYGEFDEEAERKRVLGAVASQVLERFLHGRAAADPARAGLALAGAARGGHILLHAADGEVQRAFETVRVAGKLLDPDGDYLAVIGNNAGLNKLDFYLDGDVHYDVTLQRDGTALARTRVRLHNDAPATGLPDYVYGSSGETAGDGANATRLSVYCAGRCDVTDVGGNGYAEASALEQELGHRVLTTLVRLPPDATGEVAYGWTVARAWSGSGAGGGTYRLTWQGQSTVRPTRLHLTVTIPRGMRVVETTPAMRAVGTQLHWSGTPGVLAEFEVEFTPAAAGGPRQRT